MRNVTHQSKQVADGSLSSESYQGDAGVKPPDLSIVIVNWHSKEYLRNCLASIPNGSATLDYEVIVIDSGSYDGCAEMLASCYPHVRFVQSEENIGFARANNRAAEDARGRVLLFLNPDTEVRRNAIADLYACLSRVPYAGVTGCRLVNTDGTLQASCVQAFPTILNQVLDVEILHRWFAKSGLWVSARSCMGDAPLVPVEAVSGACMMIRREVFHAVNGFSTDYFMYAEDIDLCWKVSTVGFTNYFAPSPEIVHHGGGSTQHGRSKFADVMIPESVSRLLNKTHGGTYSTAFKVALTVSALVRVVVLACAFPAGLILRKGPLLGVAFRRWFAVLRWGLGLEQWVREY